MISSPLQTTYPQVLQQGMPQYGAQIPQPTQNKYGVNIEIIEPKVNSTPTQSYSPYNIPVNSFYGPQQQPTIYPYTQIAPHIIPQPPVQVLPPYNQPLPPEPTPVITNNPQPPVQVLPPYNQPLPPGPTPVITNNPQPPVVINKPVVVTDSTLPPTPALGTPTTPQQPAVQNEQTITQQPMQPMQPTQPATPTQTTLPPIVDANVPQLIADLKSPVFSKQLAAMEQIASNIETNPSMGASYLDADLVQSLTDLVNVDTTNLALPTDKQNELRLKLEEEITAKQANPNAPSLLTDAEKAEAMTLSPQEEAEQNKQIALYTLAYLQDTFAKELEKSTGEKVAINELPAINTVIETAKNNPSPFLRATALASLDYIAKPEYKPVLNEIFTIAQSDADPAVQEVAQKALTKLTTLPEATATV